MTSATAVPGWVRAGGIGLTLAYGLGSLSVLLERETRVTSYFASSSWSMYVGLVAGLGLLGVGCALVAAADRPTLGCLAILVGGTWLVPVWSGWEGGPPVVRSVASVLAPLLVPLLAHIALSHGQDQLPAGVRRTLAATYLVFGALVLTRAAVHDPHRDRYCWVDCGVDANVLLVHADTDLARVLGAGLWGGTILVAAWVTAVTLRRLAAGAVRPAFLVAAVPAVLVLLAEAGYAAFLVDEPSERFDSSLGAGLFLARACALVALGAGLGWIGGRARQARTRTASLARALVSSPGGGDLRAHLSRALGDGELEVFFWSPTQAGYVDAAGRPVEPGDDGSATRIVRGDEPVALVRHHPERVTRRSLEGAIGSAARLVLDNERLRAEWLGQAEALRQSRARVVAAADEQRRRLERDLHDGAQQRLLAATYELRLARTAAEADGEQEVAERLGHAAGSAVTALADLRDVAHGIFPAVLDEAGLAEALWSLTDIATVPVELDVRHDGRARPEAERAAYLVAKAAVEATTSGRLTLTVVGAEEGTVVEVGGAGEVDVVHLADRVGAVGGTLDVREGSWRAVIP